MEAGDHARGDVDGQGEPGTMQGLPVRGGHHHHIGQRVVDLHEPERVLLGQAPDDPAELAAGTARALAPAQNLATVESAEAKGDGLAGRRVQTPFIATAPDLPHEIGERRTAAVQVELVNRRRHEGSHLVAEQPEARARRPACRGRTDVTVRSARKRRSRR